MEGKLKRIVALASVSAVAILSVAWSAPVASAADRDCGDFATQQEAQSFSEGAEPGDPHRLDGDGDGRVCETLPCPCTGSDGRGGNGDGHADGSSAKKGAVVTKIADGDTIEVRLKGRIEDVRLIGIDTPEIYFGAECGGAEASASIKRMLAVGDRVRLFRDRSQDNRDAYDRLLRYVEKKGRDIGKKQIRKGWANVYVFESPFHRVRSYRRAKGQAKAANRGVWRNCNADFHQPL